MLIYNLYYFNNRWYAICVADKMISTTDKETNTPGKLSPSEVYDLYAPAVYGNILRIVHHVPIAEKILEQVFVNSFNEKPVSNGTSLRPLVTLLNTSRKKSDKTLEALKIFNECCAGLTVSISKKK